MTNDEIRNFLKDMWGDKLEVWVGRAADVNKREVHVKWNPYATLTIDETRSNDVLQTELVALGEQMLGELLRCPYGEQLFKFWTRKTNDVSF